MNEDQMSPDTSPGTVSKKAGVRRVNNMPMYIVGGLMGVFLLIMMLVASDRSAKQNLPPEAKEEKADNSTMFAKEIAGDRKDGIIQPQAASPLTTPEYLNGPQQTLAPQTLAPASGTDAPPLPPSSAQYDSPSPPNSAQYSQSAEDLTRIRMMKMQQIEEAIKAKTSLNATAPRSSGSSGNSSAPLTRGEQLARLAAARQEIDAVTRDDPTAAYKARMAQLQGSGMAAAIGISGSSEGDAPQLTQTGTMSSNLAQFGNQEQGDRWKLGSQPEPPRSPYELRAGFVIPAILISGINSELPGQIMAQVAQDVNDTATGEHLLIPQGSRLVGQYSSNVAYGQARVLVAWQRIVFPDGKAMDIGSMPGADSAGYAGFNDQVNNHYFRLFGSAILMSAVTAGVSLSQPRQTGTTQPTASSALSEALGQQLGQVTAQMISKNMNIAPTLEIRPGYRFNVMVTKDMTLSKPYQAFDY